MVIQKMLIGLHFRRRRENFLPYYLRARERQKGVDAAHAVSAASEERDERRGAAFVGRGGSRGEGRSGLGNGMLQCVEGSQGLLVAHSWGSHGTHASSPRVVLPGEWMSQQDLWRV